MSGMLCESLDYGEEEGRGLSRARSGGADDILTSQYGRYCLCLDLGWGGVAKTLDGFQQWRIKAESLKRNSRLH